MAGAGGAGANTTSGSRPTDPPPTRGGTRETDEFVEQVKLEVHDRVKTLLVVSWTQTKLADQVWLEFAVPGEASMTSRPKPGSLGAHHDVVLGVPGDSEVAVRIVSRLGDVAYQTQPRLARTGSVPSGLPEPEVLAYDAERASPERWLFGSVEDSLGKSAYNYYSQTFWLYIIDRKGRVVWYYADPSSNATTSFQRIARDGEYIVLERRCYACRNYQESVLKLSLDHEYREELEVPGLADSIDVTAEGSILYDANDELREISKGGEVRRIWSCRRYFGGAFPCYTNTINYHPDTDSILMSYPYAGTVVEVSRRDGELVGEYGNSRRSWAFETPSSTPPRAWSFGFQHFPNLTDSGSLLVSSHMPGCERTERPVAYQHAFLEFEIDRQQHKLREKWRYTDGPEWPRAKGMAIRLPNGNTLANYGTGGVIRELTPLKRTAWLVKFDVVGGDDFYNKMVGHNVLVDDLYAMNQAPH